MNRSTVERIYSSFFADGLEAIMKQALERSLTSVTVHECGKGLIVYSSSEPLRRVKALRFFRNTFLLLRRLNLPEGSSVDRALKTLAGDGETGVMVQRTGVGLRGTFRMIIAEGSRLIPAKPASIESVERMICEATGLRVNRSLPDHEFWLHMRSDGLMLFSLRITRHKAAAQALEKGELHPEIVDILCRLSDPQKGELFLDPFAGSGAIPIARASNFPCCTVLANDGDEEKVALLKTKMARLKLQKHVVVRRMDALRMERYQNECFDKIVTDPPWGLFRKLPFAPHKFFGKMLAEFCRVLKPGGRVVILMSREHPLDAIRANAAPALQLSSRYDILLSGKKASIYELTKRVPEARREATATTAKGVAPRATLIT